MHAPSPPAVAGNFPDPFKGSLAIETDKGPLSRLMKAFQTWLVHDLDADGFADMYAQTIAYGLLSARIADPHKKTADDFAAHMRTNPFLRELMETFLKVGGRRGKAGGPGIDFDELGVSEVVELLDDANMEAVVRDFGDKNPQEDPVIHFYELFLKEYDARKRMKRGVFYTPRPVVSYIVRSVDELLRTEFDLADGLADTTTWGEMARRNKDLKIPESTSPGQDFVQILDPATGTGTFLVEVIDLIHKTLVAKWKEQGHGEKKLDALWNEYVPRHLLTRLHGYELLMAPYAIAHLKIGLKLFETGYRFGSEERARIYLTNALEPARDSFGRFEFAIPALAHEAQEVNEVKRNTRFTIVIGNPPYFAEAGRGGDWIASLMRGTDKESGANTHNYFEVDGAPLGERTAKWINDDYVKFFRLSERLLELTQVGILGFVSNHSWIDNPTFRGVRQCLLQLFNRARILDLHGNATKKERGPDDLAEENVFEIKQGVAISLLCRTIRDEARPDPQITYGSLWGTRQSKYSALRSSSQIPCVSVTPVSPAFLFSPQNLDLRSEFLSGFSIGDVFPLKNHGIITKRDALTVHFTPEECWKTVKEFLNCPPAEAYERFDLPEDVRDWSVVRAQDDLRSSGPSRTRVYRVCYRPLNFRYTYYTGNARGFLGWPVDKVMRHMLTGENLALVATRQTKDAWGVLASNTLVGHKACGAYDINTVFPLYVQEDGSAQRTLRLENRSANLASGFLRSLSRALQLPQTGSGGLPAGLAPDDIFCYAYGVFHSPGYRNRYGEFLKSDFPRLPLTEDIELFRTLARLGGDLTALHLLESPMLGRPITDFLAGRNLEVEKVAWSKNTVWIDKAQTTGFRGVREAVWNFYIGGYQVCEKWLKDRRGRTLSTDDIAHFQKIVVALAETIRLMKEIDEVIEQHGGWPGAFVTSGLAPSEAEAPEGVLTEAVVHGAADAGP